MLTTTNMGNKKEKRKENYTTINENSQGIKYEKEINEKKNTILFHTLLQKF